MSSSDEEGKMGGEEEEGEVKEVYYPRRNGWTCPWHPLQVLAWGFIVFFVATYFGFLVHYMPGAWRSIGYILGVGLFVTHIVSSLVASITDPAEASLRRRKGSGGASGGFLRNVFDQNKHSHVIEDRFCNLCNISVTTGAKHCSVCDKCVEGFDHHCIWLNTCIGTRNYRWFLVTVFSALVACVLLLVFTISLFITFFAGRDRLTYNCKHHFISANTSCSRDIGFFGALVPDAVFPSVVALVGLLALVGVVMIGYLAGFHVYLNVKGLSTYDYVLLLRHREKEREEAESREQQETAASSQEGDEKERREEEEEKTFHGRCWFLRRKVNRVTPSGNGDVEKSQRSPVGGVVSTSPSVDSVGLFNFGRSPTESVVSSSVGDLSIDPMNSSPDDNATAMKLRGYHWVHSEEEEHSPKEMRCQHEVVVEMEVLPSQPEGEGSPSEAAVDREMAEFGSGHGNSAVGRGSFVQDFDNGGILAFMSSANSITSCEERELGELRGKGKTPTESDEEEDGESKDEDIESKEEDIENRGTLLVTSTDSVVSSSLSTGEQMTAEKVCGERSVIVCGHDLSVTPNRALGRVSDQTKHCNTAAPSVHHPQSDLVRQHLPLPTHHNRTAWDSFSPPVESLPPSVDRPLVVQQNTPPLILPNNSLASTLV